MARPKKEGLDYFPFDVDFFNDERIQFVSARFGLTGEAIVSRLLCKIYRNGYSMKFDDDTILLFARSLGDVSLIEEIRNVVLELIKRGFFNTGIFQKYQILTSEEIQGKYEKICTDAKRKGWKILSEIDLLRSKPLFPPEETTPQPELPPEESTQSKEKESKEKESKEDTNVSTGLQPDSPNTQSPFELYNSVSRTSKKIIAFIHEVKPDFIEPYLDLWNLYATKHNKPKVKSLSNSRKAKFKTRIREPEFNFPAILIKAGEAGEFLKEKNWFTWDWIFNNETNYLKVLEGNFQQDQKATQHEGAVI